jgi:hypothetical protein
MEGERPREPHGGSARASFYNTGTYIVGNSTTIFSGTGPSVPAQCCDLLAGGITFNNVTNAMGGQLVPLPPR